MLWSFWGRVRVEWGYFIKKGHLPSTPCPSLSFSLFLSLSLSFSLFLSLSLSFSLFLSLSHFFFFYPAKRPQRNPGRDVCLSLSLFSPSVFLSSLSLSLSIPPSVSLSLSLFLSLSLSSSEPGRRRSPPSSRAPRGSPAQKRSQPKSAEVPEVPKGLVGPPAGSPGCASVEGDARLERGTVEVETCRAGTRRGVRMGWDRWTDGTDGTDGTCACGECTSGADTGLGFR